jgi:hypothetical protein
LHYFCKNVNSLKIVFSKFSFNLTVTLISYGHIMEGVVICEEQINSNHFIPYPP